MKQTVSISRLHKLAERLKTRVAEINSETQVMANPSTWRGPVTGVQIARAQAQAESVVRNLLEAERLSREMARIRGIVSMHNETLGISAKLARQDALSRHMGVVKTVLASAASREVMASDMVVGQSTGDYGMTVSGLGETQIQQLKAELTRLQREVFALSDEVAEANATRVELELADDIAALITG